MEHESRERRQLTSLISDICEASPTGLVLDLPLCGEESAVECSFPFTGREGNFTPRPNEPAD